MVEVVVLVPTLTFLMLAIVQLSFLIHNYLLTADAVGVAGRFFITQASEEQAYQRTLEAVEAVAPNLNLTLTTSLNPCTDDDPPVCSVIPCTDDTNPTCGALLAQHAGERAVVTVTYHVQPLFNMPFNQLPGWPQTFTNSVAYRVVE